jgi:uncharacterized protein
MPPSDAQLRDILIRARTIAIVGLSDQPAKDSNEVARYLRSQGYRVIPVNPKVSEVFGERSYPSLSAIPREVRVDIADIFRRSDQVVPIAQEAVRRGIPVVWMQLGIENAEAGSIVRDAGGVDVENLCIMSQHRRLGLPAVGPAKE